MKGEDYSATRVCRPRTGHHDLRLMRPPDVVDFLDAPISDSWPPEAHRAVRFLEGDVHWAASHPKERRQASGLRGAWVDRR